jgi:hypothetical protein
MGVVWVNSQLQARLQHSCKGGEPKESFSLASEPTINRLTFPFAPQFFQIDIYKMTIFVFIKYFNLIEDMMQF